MNRNEARRLAALLVESYKIGGALAASLVLLAESPNPHGGEFKKGGGREQGGTPDASTKAKRSGKKPTKPGATKPSIKPTDAIAQRHAEANQERLAKALPGAKAIPGNAPSDVEREGCDPKPCHRHQLELKTLLTNKRGAVRMTSAAQARKLQRRDEGPPPPVRRQWSVVIDHRDAYGKGTLDKAPVFPCYVREGTGSFGISSMHRVEDADELDTLMNTPPEKLPDKARAPGTGFYATWEKSGPKKRQAMAQAAYKREKARIARKQEREEAERGNVS